MENKIQDITEVELSEKEPSDAAHIYVEEDGKFRRHSFEAMKLAVQPDVEKEARKYADNAAASAVAAAASEANAASSATTAQEIKEAIEALPNARVSFAVNADDGGLDIIVREED